MNKTFHIILQVAKGIGGGVKHKFHWVKYDRDGPEEGPAQDERVIDVMFDGHRSADVALVGTGDKLRYIIATEHMKPGDVIKTSRAIPKNPGTNIYINMKWMLTATCELNDFIILF